MWYIFILLWGHIDDAQALFLTCTDGSLLAVLWEPYGMPRIEPGLTVYKSSALWPKLSLWPFSVWGHTQYSWVCAPWRLLGVFRGYPFSQLPVKQSLNPSANSLFCCSVSSSLVKGKKDSCCDTDMYCGSICCTGVDLNGKKVLVLGAHGSLEAALQCLFQRKGSLTMSSPWKNPQLQSKVAVEPPPWWPERVGSVQIKHWMWDIPELSSWTHSC